jgi:hypothetical protein
MHTCLLRATIRTQESRPSTSSSCSTLSTGDWRKIRHLLKDVGEVMDENLRKLVDTVEKLQTQVALLRIENKGLRHAVHIEKNCLIIYRSRTRARPCSSALIRFNMRSSNKSANCRTTSKLRLKCLSKSFESSLRKRLNKSGLNRGRLCAEKQN